MDPLVLREPCPTCGAQPGSPCIGRRGPRKAFHVARWELASPGLSPAQKHARAVRLNVPCLLCGATKGQHCTHPSGDLFLESHDARLAIATRWVTRRRQKSSEFRINREALTREG